MKLRIRGNSVRLRLTRGEVDQFASEGRVSDAVDFGEGRLEYRLLRDAALDVPAAAFSGGAVEVRLPEAAAERWVRDETEVSVEGTQALPREAGEGLRILVEKDFACLKPRTGEDESDMFAHPEAGRLEC